MVPLWGHFHLEGWVKELNLVQCDSSLQEHSLFGISTVPGEPGQYVVDLGNQVRRPLRDAV